ncbi:hypothetical protein QE375_003663 [Microbacterium foliorum]|uniref:Ribbon-helix-helix protein CopG domain-containing protein n=1 Tax=Microbacterium foliorum TaxID=104336 RepID=A0ABU1HXW9_9MICO|nr:hypothetical protein [Microbacterium foliorum]MDR6144109.1 hypothetical protein [Microbacterium foliorum]
MTHPHDVDVFASSRDAETPLHDADVAGEGEGEGEQAVVAVRMSANQLAGLTEIQRHLGGSRSDAVRYAVEIVANTLSDAAGLETLDRVLGNRLASRRPVTVNVDPAVANEVRHALDSVARRYAEQAIALQRVGNDWNLLTNLAVTGTSIDTDALRAIERQLTEISSTMSRQARSDADLAIKTASVF